MIEHSFSPSRIHDHCDRNTRNEGDGPFRSRAWALLNLPTVYDELFYHVGGETVHHHFRKEENGNRPAKGRTAQLSISFSGFLRNEILLLRGDEKRGLQF
jgi:hypothetical protein